MAATQPLRSTRLPPRLYTRASAAGLRLASWWTDQAGDYAVERYARDITEDWWDRTLFKRGLLGLGTATLPSPSAANAAAHAAAAPTAVNTPKAR